jgi:hypothetical protein
MRLRVVLMMTVAAVGAGCSAEPAEEERADFRSTVIAPPVEPRFEPPVAEPVKDEERETEAAQGFD